MSVAATSELEVARRLASAAAAALEASRQRIDDLNVYPVPDGDTGTNMALTVRAVVEALEASTATDRETFLRELTRAALMGARGNSGVILSQIVRGFAVALADGDRFDAPALARALRAASDAAYRGVGRPVEGTMLTVIREAAEEAESLGRPGVEAEELLRGALRRAEEALARTPMQLKVLHEAGVVDAGGAGLVELLRGVTAAVAGEPLPEPASLERLPSEAVHQEPSRYRYCTVYVIEGTKLDLEALERQLEPLGDSMLVVGDEAAVKVHLHTDDPGAALSLGVAAGVLDGIEIADMHRQTAAREERLLQALPARENRTDLVAVVAGEGNRRLFRSLGAAEVVDGGQSMNPSTAELLSAIERARATEVVLLPNNANVLMSAEQAALLAEKPVVVVPTRSLQEGLAAVVAYDGEQPASELADEMRLGLEGLATGAVTTASRELELGGRPVRAGDYLGLLGDEPFVGGAEFDAVARAVLEQLLAQPRHLLTLLTGADAPPLEALLQGLEELHPGVELEIYEGGQPHYPLLISAE